jgi:hypothetical protein
MQVPCAPTGNIVARVTAASGSYLRLVLLEVGQNPCAAQSAVPNHNSDIWLVALQIFGLLAFNLHALTSLTGRRVVMFMELDRT